ncbi:MAG: bifunctional diaminohydroxyphosphoribosylaminopyrimidine deaminase/5-amino-6-(5-phosphoribosylamino)uracil reductase RibD [Mucinivorans sp.]
MDNENYMERAIALARKGQDNVWPNPMVGAIVVSREGEILGEGYHEKFGQAHAEVNALKAVKNQENIAGSTMYVTLEPCSHYGKTPPCADLIIKNKISKVVVGSIDPNPKVAGTGIEKLRKAGIEVIVGVMENECKEINPQFFTIYEKKRPYIILKWAQSSDAFLDIVREKGTKPAWLTGEEGRQMVHKWRAQCDAIMVGRHTVELDNPQLTVRACQGTNPLRVVLDRHLQLSPLHEIFDNQAPTLTFTECESKAAHSATQMIDYSKDTLPQILDALRERQVRVVMVEGGAQLLNSFIESALWDEARIFTAKRQITDYYSHIYTRMGVAAPEINGRQVDCNPELGLRIIRPEE